MFSTDGMLYRSCVLIYRYFALNLLFLLSCIPVVTIPAAVGGLFFVTRKHMNQEEPPLLGAYWRGMRENWLQSSIVGVILFALAMLWLIDIRILIHERSLAGHIGMILLISVTLIVALAFIHIFPLMVHMNLTTFQLFIHTLKLGFVKPWLSLVNLAVFGLLVCGAVLFKWLFLAFFFSVSATVTYWFANRKFKFLMSVSDPSSANQK